jgi:hypothetical protein
MKSLILGMVVAIVGCQEAVAKGPRVMFSSRRIKGPDNTVFAIYRRPEQMLRASVRRNAED